MDQCLVSRVMSVGMTRVNNGSRKIRDGAIRWRKRGEGAEGFTITSICDQEVWEEGPELNTGWA